MSLEIEKIGTNKVKFSLEVTTDEWTKALDEAFVKVSKDVKVDGFRPGKLPKASYIRRFGYESLYEEALNIVLGQKYYQAVVSNNIPVVNQPKMDVKIEELSYDKGFVVGVEVDVIPEVTLSDYQGLKVMKPNKEVSNEEVEARVKQMLEQKCENVIKDGAIENGDTAVIDFEGFVDGVAFEGGKAENYALEIGSHSFIPGFEEQLIGLKAEDEKAINVNFPENYHESLAGKAAVFQIKVHEVKNKVYPELDEDLVKELEIKDVNTPEEYRNYIKADLAHHKEHEAEDQMYQELLSALTARFEIDLPTCMIDRESEHLEEKAKKQAEQYKIPFEMFLQYMGKTLEEFQKEAREVAEKRIKEDLALEKVIELANIVVSDQEMEEEYNLVATGNKMELAKVKELIEPDNMKYNIARRKAISVLKENAIYE